MKVLYDGIIYSLQSAGGVNQYLAKLIDLLPRDVLATLATNELRAVNFPHSASLRLAHFQRFWFRPGRLCFLLEKAYFRWRMLGRRYDIFHPSVYGENLAQAELGAFRAALVVTVHDMIEELYPEVDPGGVRSRQKAECIALAKAIICVSENTRADLLARYPDVADKVHVIPNGCEIDTSRLDTRDGVPKGRYLLFVGGRRSAYKNFDITLSTLAELADEHADLRLVVAGEPLSASEEARIEELGIAGRVVCCRHPEEALLARLYRWSEGLLYPSLYEGVRHSPTGGDGLWHPRDRRRKIEHSRGGGRRRAVV